MDPVLRAMCVLVVLFAGCTRSVDPLEWKLSGDTPVELQNWLNDNLPLMPRPLAEELAVCVSNIQGLTPGGFSNDLSDKARNLTRRLDGKTVREVLIEGHEITNRSLLARLQSQADMITRFIERHEELTADQEAAIADRKATMERTKQHLAESDRRLEQLRAGRPAS